jgi:hypothetical protein
LKKIQRVNFELFFAFFTPHQTHEVRTLEIITVFVAESRVDELLRENLDFEQIVTAFEAATELQVFHIFLLLLAILDIAVKRAVLGNRVTPKFATATRFLANLELNALLLFVLR